MTSQKNNVIYVLSIYFNVKDIDKFQSYQIQILH